MAMKYTLETVDHVLEELVHDGHARMTLLDIRDGVIKENPAAVAELYRLALLAGLDHILEGPQK
jgi:hypothetical protein